MAGETPRHGPDWQPFEELFDHFVAGEAPFIPFSFGTLADVKGIHNWVLEKAEDHTEVSR
jgi:hypothetical protein